MQAHTGGLGIATLALEWAGGQAPPPTALPTGRIRHLLHWRLNGPRDRSGRALKISLTLGFDLQTVKPVARHHIPPNCFYSLFVLYFCFLFCVICVLYCFLLFCILFLLFCCLFPIFVQVYGLLPPAGNPVAVNT